MIRFLVVLFMTALSHTAGALELVFDSKGLNPHEIAVAQHAIKETYSRLPKLFQSSLHRVSVQFIQTSQHHMGQVSQGKILVNRNLLHLSQTLSTNSSSRHTDVKTLLVATLIHEISHLYDFLNLPDLDLASLVSTCQFQDDSLTSIPECQNYRAKSRSISQNWSFLKAAGWWIDTETNSLRQGNYFLTRSPDYYEFKNPEESFAVNMEYFLLDPQFKCRKPVLYKNLKRLLSHEPFSQITCEQFTNQMFVGPWDTKKQNPLTDIPFDRLYQIHWLHAGEGKNTMSRFGHSMLRLVLCAPHRSQISADCLGDISHHLVLTYRGSVEETSIDSIKGLRGKYPSILFVNQFASVINEYTRDEFRNLYSYPLNLSREEMKSILDSALEAHWAYEGKYYFISNNCGVETINLIKKSLSEKSNVQLVKSIRPDTLVEQLKSSGILNLSEFKPQYPYFFPTRLNDYTQALNSLKKANVIPSSMTLEKWSQASFDIREEWLTRAEKNQNKLLIGYLHLIEVREAFLLKRRIRTLIAKNLERNLQNNSNQENPNKNETLNEQRKLLAQLRSAGHILGNNGYGRPTQQEVDDFFASLEAQKISDKAESLSSHIDDLIEKNQNQEMINALNRTSQLHLNLLNALGIDTEIRTKFENLMNNNKKKQ